MSAHEKVNDVLVRLFNDIMDIEQKTLITGQFSNITNNDMHIIEAIGNKEPKSMTTIARSLKVTVGTLTIAINNLVKKGYVDRERSEEDRRVVLISLTNLGLLAYRHHEQFHQEMVDATLRGLTQDEIKVLVKALTNLNSYFRNYE